MKVSAIFVFRMSTAMTAPVIALTCLGTHTPRQFDWQRGQLAGLQIGGHQALNFAYNSIGLEQSRQTELGFNLHHDWDDRGRLQAQRLGGNQPYAKSQTLRNYHYDNLDRLVGIDDEFKWDTHR